MTLLKKMFLDEYEYVCMYVCSITKITPAKSKRHQDALIEVAQTMQNSFRMYVAQLEKKGREDPITFWVSARGVKS